MRPGDSFSCEAIVLRVLPYEETHSLVKLLSPEHGKLSCFARGAQRSRKRFGAFLQPGSQIRAFLKSPRAETSSSFYGLEMVESLGDFTGWQRDFQKLQSAMFSLSLLNSVLPDGPIDEKIYKNLQSYIQALELAQSKEVHQWLRLLFWLNLSMLMGHTVLIPELQSRLATLCSNLRAQGSDDEGLSYRLLARLETIPEIGAEDFQKVSREWRRVSEHDWDYSKVLY